MFIFSTTSGKLGEALENWIIDNKCNPTTQEEWNRCLKDLMDAGVLTPLKHVENDDVDGLKKFLKDNFNVEET